MYKKYGQHFIKLHFFIFIPFNNFGISWINATLFWRIKLISYMFLISLPQIVINPLYNVKIIINPCWNVKIVINNCHQPPLKCQNWSKNCWHWIPGFSILWIGYKVQVFVVADAWIHFYIDYKIVWLELCLIILIHTMKPNKIIKASHSSQTSTEVYCNRKPYEIKLLNGNKFIGGILFTNFYLTF